MTTSIPHPNLGITLEQLTIELAEIARLHNEHDTLCAQLKTTSQLSVADVDLLIGYREQLAAKQQQIREWNMFDNPEKYFKEIQEKFVQEVIAQFLTAAKTEIIGRLDFYFSHIQQIINKMSREMMLLHPLEVRVFHGLADDASLENLRQLLTAERQQSKQSAELSQSMAQAKMGVADGQVTTNSNTPTFNNLVTNTAALDIEYLTRMKD